MHGLESEKTHTPGASRVALSTPGMSGGNIAVSKNEKSIDFSVESCSGVGLEDGGTGNDSVGEKVVALAVPDSCRLPRGF